MRDQLAIDDHAKWIHLDHRCLWVAGSCANHHPLASHHLDANVEALTDGGPIMAQLASTVPGPDTHIAWFHSSRAPTAATRAEAPLVLEQDARRLARPGRHPLESHGQLDENAGRNPPRAPAAPSRHAILGGATPPVEPSSKGAPADTIAQ